MAELQQVPPAVMVMLQQANIVLYPVRVRGIGGFATLESELSTHELSTASGGRAFYDAKDLAFAVQTAQEDAGSSYVLGYYPSEDILDGKFHKISLNLNNERLHNADFEVHYRSGYLATKAASRPPAPTLAELFEDPLDSSGIGLAAQSTPEARHPGLFDVSVTVDLHDIHLDRKGGHSTGAFDVSVLNPSPKATVRTGTVAVNLTDVQLVDALENGFTRVVTGVEPELGEIRVVVRDRATGTAGSLRVPVAKPLR